MSVNEGFAVSLGVIYLTVDEVWPDGDAPESPTAKDVAEQMRKTGSVERVLREWNMIPDDVEITGMHLRDKAFFSGRRGGVAE